VRGLEGLATGRSLLIGDSNEGDSTNDRRKPDDQKGHLEPRDLHGLEDKHDEFVVDSLLFVKDTVPGADEEEHHCLSAYTPIER
jgi:hypothetical protein